MSNPWNNFNSNKNFNNVPPFGGGQDDGDKDPPRINLIELIKLILNRINMKIISGFLALSGVGLLASGVYIVRPDETALVLRFGKCVFQASEGIHWHMPIVEEVITVSTARVRQINIGKNLADTSGDVKAGDRDGTILTGDQNIIDVDYSILWAIGNAKDFVFNIRNHENVIRTSAASAMRHVISNHKIQNILTDSRDIVQVEVQKLLQGILDSYKAGVIVTAVQLKNAQPPEAVIDAFDDVQRAMQDMDRLKNEAEAYSNSIIPQARGDAFRIIEKARAYSAREVNVAEGYAYRYLEIHKEYKKNPEIVKQRIYADIMGKIYRDTKKIIVPDKGNSTMQFIPVELSKFNDSKPVDKIPYDKDDSYSSKGNGGNQ